MSKKSQRRMPVNLSDQAWTSFDAWFFIGHRRYVKDGHWIRDAGFLIGKR